jgi:pyridoxine kinase
MGMETKKIAVINDLSGFGRCSLVAAISVISAMGVQPCPYPTAILSAQTGYPSYFCEDYTDRMDVIREEWAKMQAQFDGIYTGFVASERQIEKIFSFLKAFRTDDTFLLVDPVLGDDGQVYAMYTQHLCEQMKALVRQADLVTPNITEICLLTDTPYERVMEITDVGERVAYLKTLARQVVQSGPHTVVVTGVPAKHKESGEDAIGNLAVTSKDAILCTFPHRGGSYSGTGDLFASVLAAGMARGMEIQESMKLAGDFIQRAIADTRAEGTDRNDGVNYEKYLSMLLTT